MSRIPFSQLEAFLAVARARSFSGAARDLAVSRSAVSQSIRQLEKDVGVVLVARTTRSVSLTDAGRRLAETTVPAVAQLRAGLEEVSAKPGETVGRVRLTAARAAYDLVLKDVLPEIRLRNPRIELECFFEDRRVDIVAEGFDAGIRLSEYVERDMVSIRLTDPFRFIVVGSPGYLEKHGTPRRPEDLLQHECVTFRSETTGALYGWELERGRKTWRVPVKGGMVTNDGRILSAWVEQGLGLGYAFEPLVADSLRAGRLRHVLEPYSASVPGFFLYFPSRAQRSAPLQVFVATLRELVAGRLSAPATR